jgi:deazaflavin-dependent oxidoreductase (nitroreductase family)
MIDPNKVVDRMWPVVKHAMAGHTLAYRASGGLIGHRVPGMPPMLLLDHVGAKSGKGRATPLAYLRDGDDYVIVASRGGHPKNPAWFHNLKANPDTTIQVGRERIPVRAHVATAAQHKRLWPKVVDLYGGYQGYQDRTERKIPLVILKRRSP